MDFMALKTLRLIIITGLLLFSSLCIVQAQEVIEKPKEDHSYKPLTLKLNETGSKYIRFIVWHQMWLTTNNMAADNAKLQVTPSIRRSRFLAFTQVSSKFLILTHFGLNSLSPNNLSSLGSNGDAPQLFLHDAWAELKLNKSLYVGTGLHYWKGLTRMSNQSTLNFMTLDQSRPFIGWHSLGITDQFARHLGVYAKGAIEKFDYRVAINSPLRNNIGAGRDYGMNDSGLTYNGVINADRSGDPVGNAVIEGYFRYNFWDTESTKLPYAVGTYLGAKKVFSLGAGFFAHPNGMYDEQTGNHSSVTHLAVDAFLDMPTGDGNAINAYAAFMNFDYGDDYVSRWAGTGTAIYAQLGYYLKQAKLMPYVAIQNGNYDGLEDNISALDIGMNYYISGHNAKLTFEYHRIKGDIREGAIATGGDSLSQLRLQLHLFL